MRILFADRLDADHIDRLAAAGHECVREPDLTAADLPGRIAGFDALVVRSTRVEAATLQTADRLQIVVRAGAGTNTIDTDTAAALGIFVSNVPGRNAIAVAELTMGLILALDRNIPDNVAELRAGRWDKARFSKAQGLFGRHLAILGTGAIGMAVAERAGAFGMRVLTEFKQRPEARQERLEALGVETVRGRGKLLGMADIVSLHVPLLPETRGLVDAGFLGQMRDGAWLINTSRGEIVDEEALLDALDHRGMRAGLDVFPDEPGTATAAYHSRLASHPSVYGTHHIGASTAQAQQAIAAGTVEVLEAFSRGEVRNCVNLEMQALGQTTIWVRHRDRIGVLSSVLEELKRADLNVQGMHNRIFRGATAAIATIEVDAAVDVELLDHLRDIDDVIQVTARPIERST